MYFSPRQVQCKDCETGSRNWEPSLEDVGGTGHLEQVADIIAHCFGATKKFLILLFGTCPREREKRRQQNGSE